MAAFSALWCLKRHKPLVRNTTAHYASGWLPCERMVSASVKPCAMVVEPRCYFPSDPVDVRSEPWTLNGGSIVVTLLCKLNGFTLVGPRDENKGVNEQLNKIWQHAGLQHLPSA